ncbi:hypothetical protein [Flavobacterium sp.]|uniref:hypothetical protein n=1 Tax=Flavobacterium sp. TaxID=239 RepID=UPI00375252DD
MKKIVLLFVFLISSLAHCQYMNHVASQIGTEFIKADQYVGEDAFGYKYFIKNGVLFKIKKSENYQYKNIALGKISRVDIQNSLKIILFYENFNTAIILDNQLNEIQKISFSESTKNIIASAIGISSHNSLWVFNSVNQQIGLYDYLKKEYKNIAVPVTGVIKYYQTNFNNFYWIDERNYCYSCDIFGKIIALGKVPDFDSVQLTSNLSFIFKKNGILYYQVLNDDKKTVINLTEKSYLSFYYVDQNLSIFTDEGITKYQINLP